MNWQTKLTNVITAVVAGMLLFATGCGDAGGVQGGLDGPGSNGTNNDNNQTSQENPFGDDTTLEEQFPAGPHLRPGINYAIVTNPAEGTVVFDEENWTVTFSGSAIDDVSDLSGGDILAVDNKVFRIEFVEERGAELFMELNQLKLNEVLYGRWNYSVTTGGEVQDNTRVLGSESGELRARQGLGLGDFECLTPSEAGQEFKEQFTSELREEAFGNLSLPQEANLSFDVGSDSDFNFEGNLPLGDASGAESQRLEDWCESRTDSEYCIREFKAMFTIEPSASLNVTLATLDLPAANSFSIEPRVDYCSGDVARIPLGNVPFSLVPVFKVGFGLQFDASYPNPWYDGPDSFDLRLNPRVDASIPMGYHFFRNHRTGEARSVFAPNGVGDGEYQINLDFSHPESLIESGEPPTEGDPSVEGRLFAYGQLEMTLQPTIDTENTELSIIGPDANVDIGGYARWRPTEPNDKPENACFDTGLFAEPSITAKLRAEAEIDTGWFGTWTFGIDIVDEFEVWAEDIRNILYWDREGNTCFGDRPDPPSPLEAQLRWTDDTSDLDLRLTEPVQIDYNHSEIDGETGMIHSGDACPSNVDSAACVDEPNEDGFYTEAVLVEDPSLAPDSGTQFTAEVEHFEGESQADFELVVSSEGTVVETFNGSVASGGTQSFNFEMP